MFCSQNAENMIVARWFT